MPSSDEIRTRHRHRPAEWPLTTNAELDQVSDGVTTRRGRDVVHSLPNGEFEVLSDEEPFGGARPKSGQLRQ